MPNTFVSNFAGVVGQLIDKDTAVLIVDHGSKRAESNALLKHVAESFQRSEGVEIVEHAHMELAEPTISQAFRRCVERGASRIIVYPFFLSPGRHWFRDIPFLVNQAAEPYPNVAFLVSSPLGNHPLMSLIIKDRIQSCMERANQDVTDCSFCDSSNACQWQRHTNAE